MAKNLSGFSWNDLSELQSNHGSTKNSICECTTVRALDHLFAGGTTVAESVTSVRRNKSSVWGAGGERRSHCVPCLHWPLISTCTHPTLSACSLLRLLRTSTKSPAARPTHGSPSKHCYSPIGRLALKDPIYIPQLMTNYNWPFLPCPTTIFNIQIGSFVQLNRRLIANTIWRRLLDFGLYFFPVSQWLRLEIRRWRLPYTAFFVTLWRGRLDYNFTSTEAAGSHDNKPSICAAFSFRHTSATLNQHAYNFYL